MWLPWSLKLLRKVVFFCFCLAKNYGEKVWHLLIRLIVRILWVLSFLLVRYRFYVTWKLYSTFVEFVTMKGFFFCWHVWPFGIYSTYLCKFLIVVNEILFHLKKNNVQILLRPFGNDYNPFFWWYTTAVLYIWPYSMHPLRLLWVDST